jgi:glutamyl/glutaminyl-tRNA synthetase
MFKFRFRTKVQCSCKSAFRYKPAKEEQEYVDAIKRRFSMARFNWTEERYSSDYFQQLYDWSVDMIKTIKAYVDSLLRRWHQKEHPLNLE